MKNRRSKFKRYAIFIVVGYLVYFLFFKQYFVWWDFQTGFKMNTAQSFNLSFGRGSGWHGLSTVEIDETGVATIHQENYELIQDETHGQVRRMYYESGQMRLTPEGLEALSILIEKFKITRMGRTYIQRNVHDGSQWIFWLRQGDRNKVIYFDNYFPSDIKNFASQFDQLLNSEGFNQIQWTETPSLDGRRHDKALWDALD